MVAAPKREAPAVRVQASVAPHDYRLPRRLPWGLTALAIVVLAMALPFVAFVFLVGFG